MRLSIKVAVPSAILAVDLAIFLFFPKYLPDIYDQIFLTLPWSKNLEITIILAIGLLIAIITSILLIRTITKSLFKSIQGENNIE